MSNSRHYWKDSTHTELGGGDCLTKDEVRSILAACAERHIEVIPEVQSLSHSYYLCCAYPEIAERSDDPWPDTYCVANPESYEVLFDVMEEVIEVFQPKVMHVGHDELYHIASCPRCRDRSGHELLAEDLNRIHDFLAERGVRMFMWSDKLMRFQGKGEEEQGGVYYEEFDPGSGKTFVINPTYKAADMVPGDILICDWYWGLDPKSEHYFHDHGFEMIFGNFSPLGFSDWESRSRVPWVLGAEISSWCAVEPWAFGHNGTAHAFHPGADMLWNGRQLPRGEVTRRMARAMSIETDRLTDEPRRLVSGRGKAAPIDISGAATPLAAAPTAPAKSLSGQIKAPASATTVLGTGRFDLITDERGLLARGIVIGKSNPRSKPVPVGRRAKAIQVMHGSTMAGVFMQPSFYMYHRGPAEVLRYRVRYSDGGEESFSSFFGEDIGPANGEWPTKPGGICYRAVPVDFGDHTFFAQEWENPRPDASISEIVVEVGADAVEIGDITVAAISLIK